LELRFRISIEAVGGTDNDRHAIANEVQVIERISKRRYDIEYCVRSVRITPKKL
jgi:hypothetical protein